MLLLKLNEFLDFAGIERLLHPGVVIVGEHDSLGHACGSASIDESTTIAWLNLIHPLLDNLIPDALADLQKVFPFNESPTVVVGNLLLFLVQHNIPNFLALKQIEVSLGTLKILSNHELALRVFSNVRAGCF